MTCRSLYYLARWVISVINSAEHCTVSLIFADCCMGLIIFVIDSSTARHIFFKQRPASFSVANDGFVPSLIEPSKLKPGGIQQCLARCINVGYRVRWIILSLTNAVN